MAPGEKFFSIFWAWGPFEIEHWALQEYDNGIGHGMSEFFRREQGLWEMFKLGDPVIYLAAKHSSHPGPRAQDLAPERCGEGYRYTVKKFWTVLALREDGRLALLTRRGKTRIVDTCDPNLRVANWWERLFFATRFPRVSSSDSGSGSFQAQAG